MKPRDDEVTVGEREPTVRGDEVTGGTENTRETSPSKDPLGEDAFSAQDQYLGHLVVFRKGAHVAGISNAAAEAEAAALAKALAARLP